MSLAQNRAEVLFGSSRAHHYLIQLFLTVIWVPHLGHLREPGFDPNVSVYRQVVFMHVAWYAIPMLLFAGKGRSCGKSGVGSQVAIVAA